MNRTTISFICFLVFTTCIFGQGRKLTRQEVEAAKDRDKIKSSGIKSETIFEQDYDTLTNSYAEKKRISKKTYDKNGNILTSFFCYSDGKKIHWKKFEYNEKGYEIYRLDSSEADVFVKTTTYKDDYIYQTTVKSGNANSQITTYEYKFSKDGLILSAKMTDEKDKVIKEVNYDYDKTSKVNKETEKFPEKGVKKVYKFDMNENLSELSVYTKNSGEKPYAREVDEYDDNGLLVSKKEYTNESLSSSQQWIYQEEKIIKCINYNADGSTSGWQTYQYDDNGILTGTVYENGSHPISKSVYEYEYYK